MLLHEHESGWYACRVEDGAASSELVVSVAVASAEACVPQRSAGLQWPRAAAGTAAELACPAPLAGVARRPCDAGRWGPPDLSGCLHPQFARLRDDVCAAGSNKQEPLNTAALPTQLVVKVLVDGEDWRSRMGSFAACLRVAREQPPRSTPAGWRPQCVETSSPAAPSSCGTAVSGDNYTRCLCRRPGAYAVISAPFQPRVERAPDDDQSLSAAVLGCSFCLAQTLFALALLLPCWWRHRDCFVFLKLQCCTATSGAMAVFIYGVRNSSNKIAYPYIAASLEAFLLIGTTSHVGKVLIVYIEVVQLSRSRHVNKIIVIITTGLSLLAVLCDRLIYHLLGWAQTSWWLLFGTKMFIMFTTIVSLTLAVYLFLYISVTSKLRVFSRSMTLDSRTVSIRMRFLNTGAIVLFFTVIMEASSILFINIHIVPYSYIFGCSCTLLGFTIVACYLWKSEVPVCAWMMHDVPPTQAISEENISTTTQPKCVSTNREIDQEVPTMLWSSTIQNLVKICTNIRQLMTKTSNERYAVIIRCSAYHLNPTRRN
ncbi:uncharacterized protein LOC134527071 [Bacillus rossius redtenbacheri]|uniref:uncharacterized protein LOC134527071 n=1 Tax=Bacillus rossius redtenbacheri TaxID=93214 RepID=UPI002FDEDC7F